MNVHIATRGGGIRYRFCKRNQAFTLIELLAVIVILGVIALIITPIVTGVIQKQEKKTFEESIHGILKSIEIDTANDSFLNIYAFYLWSQ